MGGAVAQSPDLPASQPVAVESTSGPASDRGLQFTPSVKEQSTSRPALGDDSTSRPSLDGNPFSGVSFNATSDPSSAPDSCPSSQPDSGFVAGKYVPHWSRLPIWGAKEACERGYELPLPLGVSANTMSQSMNFHVPNLAVGGHNGGLLDIDNLVHVKRVAIAETATTARLDAWVLPFLNLYGVVGDVKGHANIDLRPGLLPLLRSRGPRGGLHLEFEGPTGGFGGTLAGGFKPFKSRDTLLFGLTDLNFTRTFLEFADVVSYLPGVDVTVLSTRLGLRERLAEHSPFGEVHAAVWGGGMYQGVQKVMAGSAFNALNFRANAEAVDPWNTLMGGRLELGKHVVFTIEVGVGDRKSVMLEGAIRF